MVQEYNCWAVKFTTFTISKHSRMEYKTKTCPILNKILGVIGAIFNPAQSQWAFKHNLLPLFTPCLDILFKSFKRKCNSKKSWWCRTQDTHSDI